jgi:Pentapeptide repeats (8 copies)
MADLSEANLTAADLSGANLGGAQLIGTNLCDTTLTESSVYGASIWDIKVNDHTKQQNLIITRPGDTRITVDNIKVAQFIYLLLNNQEIRRVIDTVTAKAVLILGRFIDERKQILNAIRDRLAEKDYVPIIFDFDKPSSRDLTETISTLAHLSRFIIADVTDPKSIPQELMKIIPQLLSVPVQPILLEGKDEWSMFDDLKRTGRILPTFHYENLEDVRRSLRERILAPAEKWLEEFSKVRDPLQEIERLREELRQAKAKAGGGVANPTIS